jgi:hypothetical protein
LVDRGTSRHNNSYLSRAHTVTPIYSLVHDDHKILIIDEIATSDPTTTCTLPRIYSHLGHISSPTLCLPLIKVL